MATYNYTRALVAGRYDINNQFAPATLSSQIRADITIPDIFQILRMSGCLNDIQGQFAFLESCFIVDILLSCQQFVCGFVFMCVYMKYSQCLRDAFYRTVKESMMQTSL